ncbi:MAG: GNAT family N-acetyltransferase [Steroidobacteraceae bacterium]
MTVSVREARDRPVDLAWIQGQLRDYLEDLGRFNTGIFPALAEYGHTETDQVRSWLSEPRGILLTIADDSRPAGFAFIVGRPAGAPGVDYRMVEFFVARAVRRRGLGRSAARLLLDRFAGKWEVVESHRNVQSVAFWRHTIAHYTRGAYRERVANGEVRQYFSSVRVSPSS